MKKNSPGPTKGQTHDKVKRSEFGVRLFKTRKSKGISQQELGEKIGVTKRVIAFYEGDNQGPPVALLKKMAQALNVTASYLLGESPMKKIKSEIKPSLRKHVDNLQKLPPKDQKSAIRMIDALAAQNGVKS